MNKFWDEYPEIQKDLEKVTEIIRSEVKCSEKLMEKALLELVESGGKMLRPAFLILSSGFGKYNPKKTLPLAAVVEMFHMATLVHDDIIDDSSHRRGKTTIQSKYGKNYAVFMGDYLFSKCFITLSEKTSMQNMKLLSQVIAKICVGEIEQYSSKFKVDVSVKKYLKRIAAKTAILFSVSFYIGAKESKCPEKLCKTLAKVGYYTGMAFQIIDDILDFTGSEEVVGKSLGNDLKEGLVTLPVIYAAQSKNETLFSLLSEKSYSDIQIGQITRISEELGGIEKARATAQKYTAKAFSEISKLPDNPNKAIIEKVVTNLLNRDY